MRFDDIQTLEDTLNIMKKGSYNKNGRVVSLKLSRRQMKECEVFLPKDIDGICKKRGVERLTSARRIRIFCENVDSFSMARRIYDNNTLFSKEPPKILVLNLANPVNPGGGVRRGAKAQEEDLCRKSSLLLSLESISAQKYYKYNKSLNTYMGSDAIVLTPQVEIIKDDNGDLLDETVVVSVMTCAAPMITCGKEGLSEEQYEKIIYDRICKMLKCAAYWGYRELVLGAFGCGAFGNDARLVSDLFYKALKEFDFCGLRAENFFEGITFAVLDKTPTKYNFSEFSRNFNGFYRDEDGAEAVSVEEKKREACRDSIRGCLYFWHEYEKHGCFSNWYKCEFVIDDFCYQHVEQYLMAQKAKLFHDAKMYTAVLKADSAEECKRLGRMVAPFDQAVWEENRYRILKEGVTAKFSQNPELREALLATGNSIIAEASPYDSVYGIKLSKEEAETVSPDQWKGLNLLGKVLMEVRKELSGKRV